MTMKALYLGCAALLTLDGCTLPTSSPEPVSRAGTMTMADRLLAPVWAVGYGNEFWRAQQGISGGARGAIGEAVERVTHAIVREHADEVPVANTRTYRAAFDGVGVRFSPATADEVRLRTARVAIGDDVIYAGAAERNWSIVGNTAQAELAAGLVEHYETRRVGIEVSWVVRKHPDIVDDLVVDLAVEGLAFTAATSDGAVHYADRDGTARMRIGDAVLADAGGRRWPVAIENVDDGVRFRVAADVLAQAEYPIALDPIVSSEFGLDTPVISRAPQQQGLPSVACNGTDCLVVWEDTRGAGGAPQADVIGTRISAAGVIRDPSGILVSVAPGNQLRPSVASTGGDFLVAWQDARAGTDTRIYFTRVTAAGVVMNPAGTQLAALPIVQSEPVVASNGTSYLVVFVASSMFEVGYDIYASRVSATGAIVDTKPRVVSDAPGDEMNPAVAARGSEYLVAWGDHRNSLDSDVYAARISAAGTVLDSSGIAISNGQRGEFLPSVASNGTDYLVAWSDQRAGTSIDVYATRVSATGAVLDAGGVPVSTDPWDQNAVSAASDGSGYLLAWSDGRSEVYASRISATGAVLDPNGIALPAAIGLRDHAPAVAFDGGQYLVTWSDNFDYDADVFAARVTPAGAISDPNGLLLSLGPHAQDEPVVAASSSGFLAVWEDFRTFRRTKLFATRLDPDGTVLDPNGILIVDPLYETDSPSEPCVASNGDDYLVAWHKVSNGGDLYAARITATGSVLDPNGFLVSSAPGWDFAPTIASDGTNYMIAWSDERNPDGIYASRVSAAGVVGDPNGIAIETAGGSKYEPAIAHNGTGYLITWYEFNAGLGYDVYARRLSGDGVVDAMPIVVAAGPLDQRESEVASNGTDFLVAWRQSNGSTMGVYATRVTGAGTVVDMTPIAVSTATGDKHFPTVASNGSDYLVAWSDARNGHYYDVYASRVTSGGAVMDPNAFAVSRNWDSELKPRLAFNAVSGAYLAVYVSLSHARARLISLGATCGNGALDLAESCDDGDVDDGDGCSASCAFEPGFTCLGIPTTCVDIDECATNNGGCSQTCTNTDGGFTCSCAAGHLLNADGRTCDDIDECATSNGGCADTCTNTIGSRECSCPPSAELGSDGMSCDDIDECAAGLANCDANADCTNTAGSFTCECKPGYSGDGTICTFSGGNLSDPDDPTGCGCQGTDAPSSTLLLAIACLLRKRRRGHPMFPAI
jgi:cysteine-rich repeat protein